MKHESPRITTTDREGPISAQDVGRTVGNSIVVRLLATHNLLLGALRTGFGPSVSLARFDLLAQLDRDDGQTLAALSRKMLVTAGNLTGLVDRAERDGIVERRPDETDRRLTRVHLLPKGARLAAQMIRRHAELADEIVDKLDHTEREDLRRLLGRLRESLEALPREPSQRRARKTKIQKRTPR
jgi:DNA-binding MarR family transcriptional regulator